MGSEPGLFGKLPAHGDFVARGLAAPMRKALDHWITRNIGQMALPGGGVRAQLILSGKPVLLLILASHDKPGRVFPLVAVTAYPDQAEVNAWCDAAAEILAHGISEGLDASTVSKALPRSVGQGVLAYDAMWHNGQDPQPLKQALATLSSG